jgi:hypothetical protein
MPFTEAIKREAKQRSNFQCAACRQPFVEVHHLIPQSEGGPDSLENACPLCARCHDLAGGNPDKRKQLREIRDFQWESNAKWQPSADTLAFHQKLDAIHSQLTASKSDQDRVLADIKSLMIAHNNLSNVAIAQVSSIPAFTAVTGLSLPRAPISDLSSYRIQDPSGRFIPPPLPDMLTD